jgi:hypothetical protein
MERTIVLENLDGPSAAWIEQEAERRETTHEQIVLELVRTGIQYSRLEEYSDLDDLAIDPSRLRQALRLGLAQLQEQQQDQDISRQAVEVLLSTGRARRLPASPEDDEPRPPRRKPLKLPGTPVSEILIAQRRGEL